MQGDNQRAFHIQKISQHPVIQFRGKNLYKADRSILFAHAELLAGAELKGAGGDEILGGQPTGREPVPLKSEWQLLIHVEDGMELCQPRLAVQSLGSHAQALKVVEDVRFDTLQPGFGGLNVVSVDAESQVLGLDKTVVAPGQLVLQHGGVLHPDAVKIVSLERDGDSAGKGLLGGRQVQKGQLKPDGTVEVIEEITPALKDCGFVLILRELVVDVLELDGLGVVAVCHTADTVRPHLFIGDTVLG